jgi:hypothetical protein
MGFMKIGSWPHVATRTSSQWLKKRSQKNFGYIPLFFQMKPAPGVDLSNNRRWEFA